MGIALQYFAAISSALGAFCAGNALGWTANLQKKIINHDYGFEVSELQFSIIGSMLNFGAACVCILMGFSINLIGRRGTMLLILIPFIVGWVLLVTAADLSMLLIGRALLGIASGGCCVAMPVYIGEIADKKIRGKLSSFFQLFITSGIMFVYTLGANLSSHMTSAICGLFPLLFGFCIFFCPESPTYYIMKGKNEEAVHALKKFRGRTTDLKKEINELINEEEHRQSHHIGKALKRISSRKAMMISFGLMFFQQLSGINAVIFYTTTIFSDAKFELKPENATIIIGVIQMLATFIATLTVDKIGRKFLLVLSDLLMALCTLILGIFYGIKDRSDDETVVSYGYVPLLAVCIFISAFSFGSGTVSWIMIGELFSSDVKGIASSMAGTLNWTLAFIVTVTYPSIRDIIETKGKSLTEIQKRLNK
ncbi:hypothetical protein PVAND_013284 [Polypedilum vanderplanki]|uniref:Facilitated trehalose transporter Tret1 n=1 Tax=Polypedilum vanderplanki TaxID=319348 RepID=A0A9J6CQ80_POLVA|nr:hypothetical protein PVAND_013284 [Polypedilum vanderplanki]